jgi:uncharacterized protein involved in response to NO
MFGYFYTLIAGFILTASAHWNNSTPQTGSHLAFLCFLFVMEKFSILANFQILSLISSIVFALYFYYLLNKQLGNNRNKYPMLLITTSLSLIKTIYLADTIFKTSINSNTLYNLAQILILILVSIIVGRVTPVFTKNFLKLNTIPKAPQFINIVSIAFPVSLFITLFESTAQWINITLYTLTFIFQLIRLSFWKPNLVKSSPTISCLHFANLFFVLGFLFKATLYLYPSLDLFRSGLHFHMMGGVTLIALNIMMRASLGHTGRRVDFKLMEKLILFCVTLGVLIRVFVPIFFPQHFGMALHNGMGFWTLAFILFAFKYFPYFFREREKTS